MRLYFNKREALILVYALNYMMIEKSYYQDEAERVRDRIIRCCEMQKTGEGFQCQQTKI